MHQPTINTSYENPAAVGKTDLAGRARRFAAALLFTFAVAVALAPATFAQNTTYDTTLTADAQNVAPNQVVTYTVVTKKTVTTTSPNKKTTSPWAVTNVNLFLGNKEKINSQGWIRGTNLAGTLTINNVTGIHTFLYTVSAAAISNQSHVFAEVTDGTNTASSTGVPISLSDTTPPTLNLPDNITTNATSLAGATVNFTATASDASPANPTVTCTPASGSTFAIATTTVNCSATDAAGNIANGSFTVTVVKPTTPITFSNLSQTYNGSPRSAGVTTDPAGLPLVITYNGSATVPTAAGTYTVAATVANTTYYQGSASDTLVIDKAPTTTTVTCAAGPFTYSGSAQTPCTVSVTGAGGLSLTPAAVYANNTGAGTASASYTYAESANYLGSDGSADFTIGKANQTITFNTGIAASPTYGDGTFEAFAAVSTSSLPITYSAGPAGVCSTTGGTTITILGAGTCTVTASQAGDGNFLAATDETEDYLVAKAPTTTTVTCAAGPFTYNGSAQTPCTVSVTGAGGLSLTPTADHTNNVNAGTASASYTYAESANHLGSTGSKNFEIGKATSTVTVTCPTNQTFTGAAIEPCSAKATGAGGLDVTVSVSYGNNVNAGSATAAASYPGDANHDGDNGDGGFTIDKAATTTTVTCTNGPFTYNGSAQTPCSASVTGAGGLNQSLSVTYSNNTNAGTAGASASYAESGNYLASSDSETFTINKANASISVTGFNGFYDGAAHGATITAAGVGGADLNSLLTITNNSYTNVPGGTANWTFNGGTNYNNDSGTAQIVIKAWTTSGFYQPVDMSIYTPQGVLSTVVWNTVKGGSTVPLKFELFAGNTEKTSTFDIAGFAFVEAPCLQSQLDANVEFTTTGGTSLRYDTTGGQFIQNWQTPRTVGKCYQVRMTAKDGSKIDAFFKTK